MPGKTIVLLGVNHKTTPLAVREKLALSGGYDLPLEKLGEIEEVSEYYLLSTCNRVETIFTCADVVSARRKVMDTLFGENIAGEELDQYIYTYQGNEAVRHLFTVASSLDSMIIGESQILGQIKEAYRHATQQKSSGLILNKLLHKSFSVAKRVRTETRIGASAVSISYAAVELARKIFGNLQGKKIMLIGAGEMAELAAEHLMGQGIAQVIVANRTLERAVNLARCFNGQAASLEELLDQLEVVDIVVSSTGSPDLVLRVDEVRMVMRRRRNRPLFLIDIAVPRDLDNRINELDNVYLYNIDDLKNVVEKNKTERDREAVKAGRIVAEECLKFERWQENLATTPTIVELQQLAEAIARREYEKTVKNLGRLSEQEQKAIEKMASSIASKMLHHPVQYLKTDNQCTSRSERIAVARQLFDLDAPVFRKGT